MIDAQREDTDEVCEMPVRWGFGCIRCRFIAGPPAKNTAGVVAADTNGTRSILEACAPRAYTNGLRHRASRAPAGRRIRIGMRNHEIQSHCASCSEVHALRLRS
jgi:hypothetical protein